GAWGSWQYLENIGKAGMGYLRTGDEAYLGPFRCELLRFFKQDVFERAQEAPSQIHSCVDLILAPWNLLADHPFFTTEQRRDIDEKFLLLACSHEGPRQLAKAGWGLRGNHGLGRALDGFWLGRYFQRRYGVPEATEWLEYVDRYFEPQLLSNKPTEDGGYHQYQASLLCTLMYAMAAGKQEYLIGTAWREAADRAILEHRVGSGPMAYLSARAVYANDPSYLALVACEGPEAYVKRCAAMKHASVLSESLRSFCGFRTPEARPPLLGARVAPLSPMWHKLMDQQNPRREFRVSTEPEESYDKLVIRDAFEPGSFYLRIDGLGGGGHSFQDANCITEYRDHGLSWLRQQYGYKGPTCSTLRQQNGVFVALDGQGPPGVHACARLLYVRKLGDGLDALGGTLEGIGDVAWERHVLRKRDAWTLVVDRAKALKAGELLVERHWHVTADRSPSSPKENDGVSVYSHAKYSLHLQSVGMLSDDDSGGSSRTEIARFAAAAGESADLASLLFVDAQPQSERFSLEAIPSGWQISDTEGGSTLGVVLTAEGLALAASTVAVPTASALRRLARVPAVPEVDLEWQCIEVGNEVTALAVAEDRLAVGTKAGTVSVFGRDGNQIFRSEVDAEVLSLHAVKTDLLVGTDKGTLFCLEETGSCSWQVTIPYERIGWPHWSDRRSRIREITTADVDGDGSPEIFVSNGDRRLYAFGEDGKQRWRKGVRWGVLVALTPAVCDGAFALLGGVTGPTLGGTVKIHDAHGNIVDRLGVDRMLSQQIRDLRLHDLDGDGTTEIIVARDSASNQLVVCNEDRSLRWKADVGGSPDALAVRDWKGTPQILCASRAGYLHAFDGDSGRQQWFCYFGDDPRMVCSRTDGTVLVLCPSGRIFVVSPTGTLTSRCQLPAPITALLRPGEHRVRPSCIPIGLKNGSVHVLW
ncbi:MAG: hypothetical protein HON70_21525, partial [Lentisphaerae bacterium]|nr:hypothetical protein [Lentisphaerota bacterium]